MAYESTNVPVERSQAEIRKFLTQHGASRFAFGEERDDGDGGRWAAVTFVASGFSVRIRVPLKAISEREVSKTYQRARSRTVNEIRDKLYEQEERRIWRVMAWNIKARLVAVQEGVETFEQAFLAHLIHSSSGRTVWEHLSEFGSIEFDGPLALTAGAP